MAAKSGVLVCLYADGVGLRETVQQLSMFDSVALTGTGDRRQAADRVGLPTVRALHYC
jgi:hypothetical protein